MDVQTQANKIIVEGNIKSIEDFQKIKYAVDSLLVNRKDISVEIVDSLSITSSIIGYFNRIVLEDNVRLHLYAKSEQLLLLLEDLGLSQLFNAKRLS